MTQIPIVKIDGRRLYYMFLAGAKKIIENQVILNKINVFPVKDGDTGSNMAATLRGIIETVKPVKSYKNMMDILAESALINARGNSGIIFAQFLYGVSNETVDSTEVTLHDFAESVKKSVHYVYRAVANPVEGTMLTIINAWADFIYSNRGKFSDFRKIFINSKRILESVLAETKTKLAILKEADVVDSGAKAFLLFIEGMTDLIHLKHIRHLAKVNTEAREFETIAAHSIDNLTFRYCTEAIIRDVPVEANNLQEVIQKHGDSVVIAGSNKFKRLHVHTNNPSDLFEDIKNYGTITFQKADDMLRQSQAVTDRKWNIALVTDSGCDLSQELMDHYQINLVPINIFFGENHYLDKVTIQPEQFYKRLNEKSSYPKTAQINEVTFQNLYSHLLSHYDAVIAVHLTSKFSGTYFNSQKAAEKMSREYNKPVIILDSKNISGGLGLIVLRVAKAISDLHPLDEIRKNAQKWINDTHIYVSVKTLKYMVKGGRVSHIRGAVAKLLNVNPIVSIDEDGNSMVFGKTFTQSSNMQKVINHIKNTSETKKIWNYIVLHAANLPAANWYAEEMKKLTQKEPVAIVNISPVISANAGIGAASVAFMYE